MLHEDLRYIHEDVERLEQAIADRVRDDPKHVRLTCNLQDPQMQSLQLTDPKQTGSRP